MASIVSTPDVSGTSLEESPVFEELDENLFDNSGRFPSSRRLRPNPEHFGFKYTGKDFGSSKIFALGDKRIIYSSVTEAEGYWYAAYTFQHEFCKPAPLVEK